MKKYFTLAIFDNETKKFHAEFGDYERQTVRDEAEFTYYNTAKKHMKILTTGDNQQSIEQAIWALNVNYTLKEKASNTYKEQYLALKSKGLTEGLIK